MLGSGRYGMRGWHAWSPNEILFGCHIVSGTSELLGMRPRCDPTIRTAPTRVYGRVGGQNLQRATNDICIAPRLARSSAQSMDVYVTQPRAVFVLTWDCIAHFPVARWQTSCLHRIAFLRWVNT